MDVWKLLIKDEAEKFLIESEEKRQKKKMTQADYKSYLDRQIDQHHAQKHLKHAQVNEEAMLLRHRVQKMTEAENEKLRDTQKRLKEVTQENNFAHRSLNER